MTPTFRQRLNIAVRAAVGIFDDRSSQQAFGLLSGIWPGAIGAAPTRGARERIAAYADAPWLHAVADKVASALAPIEWQAKVVRTGRSLSDGRRAAVRVKMLQSAPFARRRIALARLKAAGQLEELTEHPFLDLMSGGNTVLTGLDVRRVMFALRYVEGEAFWVKERNALGVPIAVYPIPPHWIRATPTPSSRTFFVSFRGWQGAIPETEITWFVKPNLENPYGRGTGLARALADEIETDQYAASTQRQVFLNGARPDFVVFPKNGQTWTDPQVRQLEQDWRRNHEGFWRSFRARFSKTELGIEEFKDPNFRNLQMEALRRFSRDTVFQVAGVPPELLGVIESSNRATIDASETLFANWVLQPELESFRATLQERIAPEFDERLIVDYAFDDVTDKDFVKAMATAAPWSRRMDEWRAAQGLDPLGPEAGGELFPVGPAMSFEPELAEADDFGDLSAPPTSPSPVAPMDQDDEDEDEDEDMDEAERAVLRRLGARGRKRRRVRR
jgi:hypothetical protein